MILIFWCLGIILVQFEQQVCHSWNNVSMHLFIDWSQFWGFYRSMLQIWQHWLHSCSPSVLTHQLHNFCFLYTLLLITAVFFQVVDDLRTVQWRNVFMHFYLGIVKGWVKKSEIFHLGVWNPSPLESGKQLCKIPNN